MSGRLSYFQWGVSGRWSELHRDNFNGKCQVVDGISKCEYQIVEWNFNGEYHVGRGNFNGECRVVGGIFNGKSQ